MFEIYGDPLTKKIEEIATIFEIANRATIICVFDDKNSATHVTELIKETENDYNIGIHNFCFEKEENLVAKIQNVQQSYYIKINKLIEEKIHKKKFTISIYDMATYSKTVQLSGLNILRDYFLDTKNLVLLWIPESFLFTFISCAPDFWRIRTSVFYFNTFEVLNNQGVQYSKKHEFDKSKLKYYESQKINPTYFESFNNLARDFIEEGRYNEANSTLDVALKINNNSVQVLHNKAEALRLMNEKEKASEFYTKAYNLEPSYGTFLVSHIQKVDPGNYDFYLHNLHFNKKHVIEYDMGTLNRHKGNYDKALYHLNAALKYNPNSVRTIFDKANIFSGKSNYDEALKLYDETLTLSPDHVSAIIGKGMSLSKLGKNKEALDIFDEALKEAPNSIKLINNKANVLRILGKHKKARECYRRMIEISPEHIETVINSIVSLRKRGEYDEELKYYDEALKEAPNSIKLINNKANVLRILGKHKKARECYRRMIEINKSNIVFLTDVVKEYQREENTKQELFYKEIIKHYNLS